jgi:8-oxo-dGTP pyrophosphatase MutT (NUDIX family)
MSEMAVCNSQTDSRNADDVAEPITKIGVKVCDMGKFCFDYGGHGMWVIPSDCRAFTGSCSLEADEFLVDTSILIAFHGLAVLTGFHNERSNRAGMIAVPGGKKESSDESHKHCAIREMNEEGYPHQILEDDVHFFSKVIFKKKVINIFLTDVLTHCPENPHPDALDDLKFRPLCLLESSARIGIAESSVCIAIAIMNCMITHSVRLVPSLLSPEFPDEEQ